ncbi:MAG: hypothetical protein ACKVTZ_03495 [Bacteroidia bacterium]
MKRVSISLICLSVFVLGMWGCESIAPKSKKKAKAVSVGKSAKNFYGTWVSHDFFINLQSGKTPRRLDYQSYCTELIFHPRQKDSVWVINEDLERTILPYKLISNDSIELSKFNQDEKTILYYNKQEKMLFFLDTKQNKTFTLDKADTVKYGVKDDKYWTCFRQMMNQQCMAGRYKLLKNNKPTTQIITFHKAGSIENWDLFDSYYIYVNGDIASQADANLVGLGKKDKKESYAWVMIDKQPMELQFSKLKIKGTEKGKKPPVSTDKPEYEADKVMYSLQKMD